MLPSNLGSFFLVKIIHSEIELDFLKIELSWYMKFEFNFIEEFTILLCVNLILKSKITFNFQSEGRFESEIFFESNNNAQSFNENFPPVFNG